MKKYFVFADAHGFYEELQLALKDSGFELDNPEHCIISLGDLLDRGPAPRECLRFVNSLYKENRAILIRGNHEDLLEDVFKREEILLVDIKNGTAATIYELGDYGLSTFSEYDALKSAEKDEDLKNYLESLVDYSELDENIFVHGWIPCEKIIKMSSLSGRYSYSSDWRSGQLNDWRSARWINGMDAYLQGVVEPGKRIFCGHYHTSWGHCYIENKTSEFGKDADFSPFIAEGIVALDACTAYSKKINVFVI